MKILNELPPVLETGTLVAVDTEFFGQIKTRLHRPEGTFACISICFDGETVYQLYDSAEVKPALVAIKKGTWVFHNAAYDVRQLQRYAPIADRFIWDTMLYEQGLYGGNFKKFSLKDLVRRYLNKVMKKDARDEFEGSTEMTKSMKQYAANDAIDTLKIAQIQGQTPSAIYAIDLSVLFPLLEMPGMLVDRQAWEKMSDVFQEQAGVLEASIGINVNSYRQVINKAKEYNLFLGDTRAETLLSYKDNSFIRNVLETRMYKKAVSTYGRKWLEKNLELDDKVYANYHVTGTETGRTSCSSPNMQQIPARKLPVYRERFTASPNSVIMVSDVVQQEPCILAYESQDPELLRAIRAEEDLHMTVAKAINADRSTGKTVNLGTSYGLSVYGLAIRLGITEQEAAKFLSSYFARFNGVYRWISSQREFAFNNGYVNTAAGRTIYLNRYDNQWQNNAINAPIQGGAADCTKAWIREMWEGCRKSKIPWSLVAIVHDELVFDVEKKHVKKTQEILNGSFQSVTTKMFPGVPFRVETEIGKSWACKSLSSELVELEEDDE